MFLGEYQHTLDAKGRLIIPAKFRESLGNKCVLTLGLDGCIFLFPLPEWEKLAKKIATLPLARKEARLFSRHFFSNASDVEMDKQGRIPIPTKLAELVKMEKDATVIGVSSRIEIWPTEKWNDFYDDESDSSYEQLAELIANQGADL